MRELILVALIVLASVGTVSAKEGFSFRWSYGISKDYTSISSMDAYKEGYLDSIIAGSLDNKVYVFDSTGSLLGTYEAGSTVTAVASFVHDGDKKMNDGIAGSLDDHVYVFWRPYGQGYFKSTPHWWNSSTGDNVYAVGTFDYNASGQQEGVLAGTGNYAEQEYGKIMAFNYNGTSLWNYSVSTAVTVFSYADLSSNNRMGDVIAGAGKTVYVLNSAGSLIWSYAFPEKVAAVSYADFDLDGKKDDIVVGAGNITYALDSHKKLLWKYEFKDKIASVTPVDSDNNQVIDHFLVSAGSTFYALKNHPSEGVIAWQHNVGREINTHVSLDFEKDGILDDVAFISKNYLYAYDFDFLYLPEVELSKSASSAELTVGEKVTITLKFDNKGNGKAKGLSYEDKAPRGLGLVAGNLTASGLEVSAWEEYKAYYTIEALEIGEYELPPASASFTDSYGNSYTLQSNKVKITVKEARIEKADSTKPGGAPVLGIYRSLSKENVSVGDNLTVTVVLENLGSKPALTVNFEETLPGGVSLIGGGASWNGVLEPGEFKELTYVLKINEKGTVKLHEVTVYYRDESGKMYQAVDDAKTIGVTSAETDLRKIIIALPLALAAIGLAVFLKKKQAKKPVNPLLEEKFLKVYLKYQKKGERPTYEEMGKELGLDVREVDIIAKHVKRKLIMAPLTSAFAKLKTSIPILRK